MNAEPISDYELHRRYDDFLDEVFGVVKIAGYDYQTSYAIRSVDQVVYRCGFSDWLDSQVTDGILFEHEGEYYDERREDSSEAG